MSNTSSDRKNQVLNARYGQAGRSGKTKIELAIEPDLAARTALFTLDRHLPGEHGLDFFMYGGIAVMAGAAVKNPLAAKCESPQPRTFLTGLQNQASLEVVQFGLVQVELRYGREVSLGRVVNLFIAACAAAFYVEGDDVAVSDFE